MTEKNFLFESYQDNETIKSYLESLILGIDRKRLVFSCDGEEIVLQPDGMLHLKLKAKKKEGRNRLSIKMIWSEKKDRRPDIGKTLDIGS